MSVNLTQPPVGSTNWGNSVNVNWQALQDAINNQIVAAGPHIGRPSPSSTNAGCLYYETDTLTLFRSDGASWTQVAFGVSPTAGGDLTGTYPNPTIAASAVTNSKIANSTIDLTAKVTGKLPVANGGTNSSTALNNNRQIVSSGGALVEASALTNGQLLIGSSSAAPVAASLTAGSGVSITNNPGSISIATTGAPPTGSAGGDLTGTYPNPTIAASAVTNSKIANSTIDLTAKVMGKLPVANGGTNSSAALNNNRLIVSSGGALVEASALTNGQLLIGSLSAAPVAASLTAGSGVSITNNPGSISIATTGAPPTGSAGGDLTGTYPNPTIAASAVTNSKIANSTIDLTAKVTRELLVANGGTNSSTALNGGRPVISNASSIVESSGYTIFTTTPQTVAIGDCDSVIDFDASSGNSILNLPAVDATNRGFRVTVRRIDAGNHTLSITPSGSDGIDGTNVPHQLNAQYSHMVLRSTGTAGSASGCGWVVEDAMDYLSYAQAVQQNTSGSWTYIGYISLTPGEWDVSGNFFTQLGTAVISGGTNIAVSTDPSGTTDHVLGDNWVIILPPNGSSQNSGVIPSWRILITSSMPVPVYLKTAFSCTGTPLHCGRISARRVR